MLPELQGSPKQIAWAIRIRADKLNKWMRADSEIYNAIELQLNKETKASWWIAHKDDEIGGILKYMQGGVTVKVKAPAASALPSFSDNEKTYSPSDDGLFRYVGELRNEATGEIVVDLDCPF